MKLISLNTWAGKEFEPLMEYVKEHADDTDIFCFQEVLNTHAPITEVGNGFRANLFAELQRALPDYVGYFAPATQSLDFVNSSDHLIQYGLALFAKKSLKIMETGELYVFGHYDSNTEAHDFSPLPPRNMQFIKFRSGDENYLVTHFHGIWTGEGKGDTDARIEQSRRVNEFLKEAEGKKVVCGDFNLLPDTESLSILEEGLVNLIKTNEIETTRSSLYTKPVRHADYTLVSPDIDVKGFEVPGIEVSDHLPMELEFS